MSRPLLLAVHSVLPFGVRSALACGVLALSLAACGTQRPAAAPATDATPATPAAATATGMGAARIQIVAQSNEGRIHVALYASADTFLEEPDHTAAATPAGNRASVKFDGLAPGRYAVVVFQDLDGNEEMSMSAIGMPTEPFGFSGDSGGRLSGPPTFEPSSFEVTVGDETEVTVTLRTSVF